MKTCSRHHPWHLENADFVRPPPMGDPEQCLRARSTGAQNYDEETFNNIALPDPNLDIMPEDVPLEPLPELIPTPVDEPARVPTKIPLPDAAPPPQLSRPTGSRGRPPRPSRPRCEPFPTILFEGLF